MQRRSVLSSPALFVGNNLPRAGDADVDAHHCEHQDNTVDAYGILKAFLELGESDAGGCCIPDMRIKASIIEQGVVGSTSQGNKEYTGQLSLWKNCVNFQDIVSSRFM
jgi:hypothetical protein